MTRIIKRSADDGDPTAPAPSPGKVIDREVVTAIDESRRILDKARAEADAIVASVESARDKAVGEGFEEGRAKGLAEWLSEIERLRSAYQAVVEQAKPQVLRVALRVAEKILRQKIEASPEAIIPMVDEALRSLRANSKIILRIHPQDRELIERQRARWLERNPTIPGIDLISDETMARGGCRIETEFGMIDATIESQIRAMERRLLGDSTSESS